MDGANIPTIEEEGDPMEDEIRRLTAKLKKIRGSDPISRARKAALLKAICDLMQAAAT